MTTYHQMTIATTLTGTPYLCGGDVTVSVSTPTH